MIVLRLLVLVRVFGRLPRSASQVFARVLDAATVPFDRVNYAGPRGAVKFYGPRRMGAAFDRVIDSLHRHLASEPEARLAHGMHYPVRWDPFDRNLRRRRAPPAPRRLRRLDRPRLSGISTAPVCWAGPSNPVESGARRS